MRGIVLRFASLPLAGTKTHARSRTLRPPVLKEKNHKQTGECTKAPTTSQAIQSRDRLFTPPPVPPQKSLPEQQQQKIEKEKEGEPKKKKKKDRAEHLQSPVVSLARQARRTLTAKDRTNPLHRTAPPMYCRTKNRF